MSEWQEIRVGELGRVVTGKTPPTSEEKYFNGGFKFVSPKDMDFDSRYIRSTLTSITHEAILKFKNQVIPKNTVMFTALSYGFGKIGLANESCLTNQQINSIIVNEKKYDFNFVYYLLRNSKDYFLTFNAGIVTPIVPKSTFENIKVLIPKHKETQQKIAKILSNYDDLIENNLKRIKLLEESARLTYEEWFLRFRIDGKKLEINPESGLPFGWQDVLLTDYIDLLRGVEPGSSKYKEVKTDSNIPFIRVGDLSKRASDIYVSKDLANNKIIDKDDILLSLDGSPGKVRFGLSGCYSTGIRKAVSKQKNVSSIFIYNLLNSSYIQGLIEAYATGATILHAGSSVKKMRLILPTDEVLDKYNNIEMKKFQLILNLSDEIKLLKEAREILLPRLMTGMIDTDDMDIAV
jgi:type I restriction enzyme S subunit